MVREYLEFDRVRAELHDLQWPQDLRVFEHPNVYMDPMEGSFLLELPRGLRRLHAPVWFHPGGWTVPAVAAVACPELTHLSLVTLYVDLAAD